MHDEEVTIPHVKETSEYSEADLQHKQSPADDAFIAGQGIPQNYATGGESPDERG